jgi:hypothetical protein
VGDDWDDEDDSLPEYGAGDEMLDSLDFSAPPGPADTDDADDQEDNSEPMSVTVTNPPGSVSVTVLIDGSPIRVELAARAAVDMTEGQLAEEILLISRLARQNAQAGQHLLVAGILQRLGHDRVATRGYLEHELGLPSAEMALAEKAQLFSTRYTGDDE